MRHSISPAGFEVTGIQDLPTEILQEIFLEYLHLSNPPNWSKPTVRHSSKTFSSPVPLTHVCRYWREIACGFPDLWTSVFVLGPSPNIIPLVECWLERADRFPLTLEFVEKSFGRPDEDITGNTTYLIYKTFWQWLFLWEHINFTFADIPGDGPVKGMHEIHIRSDIGAPPEMYSARIIDRRQWSINMTAPVWCHSVYNPKLEKLEIRSLRVGPPHQDLTEFVCHEPLLQHYILDILKRCPHLEKFDVIIDLDEDTRDPYVPPEFHIIHQNLRHLSVRNDRDITISALPVIDALTCPNLKYLDVGFDNSEPGFVEGLHRFLDRSGCNLQALRGVPIEPMSKDYMIRFLSLPQVRNLTELKICKAVSPIFELLTLPPTSPNSPHDPSTLRLVPHLETFEVQYMYIAGWEFSDMLVSRFDSLKKINISGNSTVERIPLSDKLWTHPDLMMQIFRLLPGTSGLMSFPRLNTKAPDPYAGVADFRSVNIERKFWADVRIGVPTF